MLSRIALAAALVSLPSVCHADEHWYGSQILVVDAIGYGVGAATWAAADRSKAGPSIVVGTYLLAGPIIHAAHGKVGTAFASFGTRLGLLAAGVAVSIPLTAGNSQGDGRDLAANVLLLVAMTAAGALDTAVFAYEPAPTPRRVQPMASFRREGATLGVAIGF